MMDSVGAAAEDIVRAEQPRLIGLAYRMLGSISDAEDVVQEAWLRWERVDQPSIERPGAWLTTVTSRLAIDRLRAQRRRRESYVGPWLPEPVLTCVDYSGTDSHSDHRDHGGLAAAGGNDDPASVVTRNESLELGFLIVLDMLGPVERVVFVLAELFAVPFTEIAEVVDRSPEACRQVASRARRKVRDARSGRAPVDEGLLGELVGAVTLGQIDRVIELLAPTVQLTSDGGESRHAARRTVVTPERVARLLVNLATRSPEGASIAIEQINAAPGLVVRAGAESLVLIVERETINGAIDRVHLLLNPDKLTSVTAPGAPVR